MLTHTIEEKLVAAHDGRFAHETQDQGLGLNGMRHTAIRAFVDSGLPRKTEAWKYTNIAAVFEAEERILTASHDSSVDFDLPSTEGWLIVIVNGCFAPALSRLPDDPSFIVNGLASAIENDSESVFRHLGKYADVDNDALVALNTAFLLDGAFVSVSENTIVDQPIHIVNVAVSDVPALSHCRHLIVVGDHAQVTVVEHDLAFGGPGLFTNSVVECSVGSNATLSHFRLQEKGAADHVDTTCVHQAERSKYMACVVSTGDGMIRNTLTVVVDGEFCETGLRGLCLASGKSHIDNHTLIDHAKPNCTSEELYKSILGQKATTIFRGKLLVRRDAQKTAAFQSNRNLLLSADASANSLPQLEIYADDVKCSHGATTGVLDQEALFYLRARGIQRSEARKMLIVAFVDEVVSGISDAPVRKRIGDILDAFLDSADL